MIKTEELRLRVTPEEKQSFQSTADLAGVSLSSWARERLRRAARQELIEAGVKIAFLQEKVGKDV